MPLFADIVVEDIPQKMQDIKCPKCALISEVAEKNIPEKGGQTSCPNCGHRNQDISILTTCSHN
jgi:DNA-directed RNA polymerase subunit RPC12/RpoP